MRIQDDRQTTRSQSVGRRYACRYWPRPVKDLPNRTPPTHNTIIKIPPGRESVSLLSVMENTVSVFSKQDTIANNARVESKNLYSGQLSVDGIDDGARLLDRARRSTGGDRGS